MDHFELALGLPQDMLAAAQWATYSLQMIIRAQCVPHIVEVYEATTDFLARGLEIWDSACANKVRTMRHSITGTLQQISYRYCMHKKEHIKIFFSFLTNGPPDRSPLLLRRELSTEIEL
jgi:hypothetical protein